MTMTKNVEITVDIDIAKMMLRVAGFDVDNLTEDAIFEKFLKSINYYGASFQILD